MKRFLNLTNQINEQFEDEEPDYKFAFYDTVKDIIETHSNDNVWDRWEDFESDYKGNQLDRYKGLCPEWVFRFSKLEGGH